MEGNPSGTRAKSIPSEVRVLLSSDQKQPIEYQTSVNSR